MNIALALQQKLCGHIWQAWITLLRLVSHVASLKQVGTTQFLKQGYLKRANSNSNRLCTCHITL